jgi:hypothetical protein
VLPVVVGDDGVTTDIKAHVKKKKNEKEKKAKKNEVHH